MRKTASAILVLLAILIVTPAVTVTPMLSGEVYAQDAEAEKLAKTFTDKFKAIEKVLTNDFARAAFGLTVAGCLVLGLFTQLPKKPLIMVCVCAVALSAIGELTSLIFP